MKKLGKNLIVISLILLVVDYAWATLWGLRIEPAGNAFQLLYLTFSYEFVRVASYFVFALTNYHMELFWLGIALWITSRKGD